jgi:hypothetical protein
MIINLISGPRNVSTALMYSFAQRQDTTVIDEPFYGYYLKRTGIIHPGKKRIISAMETDIDLITDRLLNLDSDGKIIFLKNMAHHHIDVQREFLLYASNLFLIRDPAELLFSFSKVIKDPTIDDIGLKKSWQLYRLLVDVDKNPIVVDSGELLKDPNAMLRHLCVRLEIAYDPKMQSWPAGPKKEDGIWAKYWYHNVHKSTGFVRFESGNPEVPSKLRPVWEEAIHYYNELYQVSIKYG